MRIRVVNKSNSQVRKANAHREQGFTLIELLVVLGILVISSLTLLLIFSKSIKQKAYYNRAHEDLRTMSEALDMYKLTNGSYPADVLRNMPPGVEEYIGGAWPKAAWPESVYDWDNWSNPTYAPKEQTYQISIRFCEYNHPDNCHFPNASWAEDFDYYSSVYWCVNGPCRAHETEPIDHPACCMGGKCPADARRCE